MNKTLPETIKLASASAPPPPPLPPQRVVATPGQSYMPQFSKNFLIILLLGLLILALLGINVFIILGTLIQTIILPVFLNLWSMVAYSLGFTIDKTGDVAASAAKSGIDVANGVFDSVGNLLIASSGVSTDTPAAPTTVGEVIETPPAVTQEVVPDSHDSSIQKPIVAEKSGWCYIGTHNGTRGCAEIGEHDKCMSGLIYESKSMCLASRK